MGVVGFNVFGLLDIIKDAIWNEQCISFQGVHGFPYFSPILSLYKSRTKPLEQGGYVWFRDWLKNCSIPPISQESENDFPSWEKNLKLICTHFLLYFSGNVFPSDFETIIQRIVRLLFNVLAHIYHAHFMQLAQLDLYQHLNCVFSHIVVFCQENKTIEFTKDINALDDLIDALELNLSKPSNSSNSASSSWRLIFCHSSRVSWCYYDIAVYR